jgi:predicted nucleic acid-binding protein
MNAECFVDTNVLLYAVSSHPAERRKATRARAILSREDYGSSMQVLQEFFVNATRKIARVLTVAEAWEFIEIVAGAPVVTADLGLMAEAVHLQQRHGLSYWDAAIVAAAHALGASVLYTEDLGHGVVYGNVRAVNPFR